MGEEVAKVGPELVVSDENRKVTAVQYEAVKAMFLNES